MSALTIKILTLFPEIFPGPLGLSLAGKALSKKIWDLEIINIRDFGVGKHKIVDDEVYGGGNGMLLRADVVGPAIDFAINNLSTYRLIYTSPRGVQFNQKLSRKFSKEKNLIILCGRFEGIDERIIQEYNAEEISIGDFVLSGGEIASLAIADAVIRLLPGVLANQDTLNEESFNYVENKGTLLEYPQYTRPALWKNIEVPEVLRTGNHKLIDEWRNNKSLEKTENIRPDLLKK